LRKWVRHPLSLCQGADGRYRTELERHVESALALRFPDVELVDLELRGGRTPTLTLFVDRRGGVDLELCAAVTQALDELREKYTVEVSSPGTSIGDSGGRRTSPPPSAATSRADSRAARRAKQLPRPPAGRRRRGVTLVLDEGQSVQLPYAVDRPGARAVQFSRQTEANVSREIIEALRQIEKEKGIGFDALVRRAGRRASLRLQKDARRRRARQGPRIDP